MSNNLETDIPKLRQQHKARIKHNSSYNLYLKDIREIKKEHNKKSISLQLATRRAEREKEKKEQLAHENHWRKLRGKLPVKLSKALQKKEKSQQASGRWNNNLDTQAEAAPDVLLKETSRIVLDFSMLEQQAGRRSAKTAG